MSSDRIRSFVAVDIFSPEIIRSVRAIQQELVSSGIIGNPVNPETLHITLIFLGEVEPPVLSRIRESLAGLEVKPMRLQVGGVGYFPGGSRINTVWLGVRDVDNSLTSIQREVVSKLSELGFTPDKEFRPHVTIVRVKAVKNKSEALSKMSQLANYFVGEVVVDRVKLKKSTLTPQGPIYEDIEVFGPRPSA